MSPTQDDIWLDSDVREVPEPIRRILVKLMHDVDELTCRVDELEINSHKSCKTECPLGLYKS